LRGELKPGDLADLGREREPEQIADAGDRVQQHNARVAARKEAQLVVDRGDARVKQLDRECQRIFRPPGSCGAGTSGTGRSATAPRTTTSRIPSRRVLSTNEALPTKCMRDELFTSSATAISSSPPRVWLRSVSLAA
jgi:hypothetical protein